MATKNKNNNLKKQLGIGLGAAALLGTGAAIALTRKPPRLKPRMRVQDIIDNAPAPKRPSSGMAQVKQHTRRIKGRIVNVRGGTRKLKINKRPNTIRPVKVEVITPSKAGKVNGTKFTGLANKNEYLNDIRESQDRSNQYVLQARELSQKEAGLKGAFKNKERKELRALKNEAIRRRNAERDYRRKLATNLQTAIGGNKIAVGGKRGKYSLGNTAYADVITDTKTNKKYAKAIKPQQFDYEFNSPNYFGPNLVTFARRKGAKDKKKRKVPVRGLAAISAGAGVGGISTGVANYLGDRRQLKQALTEMPKQRESLVNTLRKPLEKELEQVNKQLDPNKNISLKQKNTNRVQAELNRITAKKDYLNSALKEVDKTIDASAPSNKAIKSAYIKKLAKTSGKGALVGGALVGVGYGGYKYINSKIKNK